MPRLRIRTPTGGALIRGSWRRLLEIMVNALSQFLKKYDVKNTITKLV